MAFEPLTLPIVPKGLNLVPPGDQVAEGDCLALTGWWPGSAGRLQQARGWVTKSGAGSAPNLDTLAECNGRIYYGGNGYLYQIGRDTGSPAYIDSGYDGKPLGVCAYQGFLWTMNQTKQSRDNGTQVMPWDVETPTQPSTSLAS